MPEDKKITVLIGQSTVLEIYKEYSILSRLGRTDEKIMHDGKVTSWAGDKPFRFSFKTLDGVNYDGFGKVIKKYSYYLILVTMEGISYTIEAPC